MGKNIVKALAERGDKVVAVDWASTLPPAVKKVVIGSEVNVDVRNIGALSMVFQKYKVNAVWNLAAPLSVETAKNPEVAEEVTVGGMRNVLYAMLWANVRRILFTDSIGSFGDAAPRTNCTARWLTENPNQNPGSDYGRQKRGCRALLKEFKKHGGDPRFAVLPGVLHSERRWGGGTTEYALEALQAAALGKTFRCPIDPDVRLPMIFIEDLMRGLLALQDAKESFLGEPENGYAIPGISFTPSELFEEIRRHVPDFKVTFEPDANMNQFAKLWPDTLSTNEPQSDLGYNSKVHLPEIVEKVLASHFERLAGLSSSVSIGAPE